jgi:hypothetical protein
VRIRVVRPVSRLAVLLLVAVLAAAVASCSSGPPPEQTLARLGDQVGAAKMDETDFASLLSSFTTTDYATDSQPEQANYQLYLTAKAADLALNQPEPPDLVEVKTDDSGSKATVSFHFSRKEGLFAVADISSIVVELSDTGVEPNQWRIRSITLGR